MKPTPAPPRRRRGLFSRQGSYQRKLLACFLSVSCVLFMAFSLQLLRISDARYRQELRSMGQSTIQQARNTCNELLLNVFRYALQTVTSDPVVTRLMYNKTYSTDDAISAHNLYDELRRYNDYVSDVYILNFQNEGIHTRSGRLQFSTFYDPALIELVEGLPARAIPVRYRPRTAVVRTTSGTLSEKRVWSLIFRPSYLGALVLDVGYEDFIGLLNINRSSEYLSTFVLNGDNEVLVASDDALFGTDLSDTPLLLAVQSQKAKEGSLLYKDPDSSRQYTVCYIKNGYLGLTYLSLVEETPLGVGNSLFLTVLMWCLAYLAASALLSVVLSNLIYRPVRSLRQALELPEETGADEFGQFRARYQEMKQKNARLESSATAYQRAAESRMLLKLVDPQAVSQRYSAEQYQPLFDYFTGNLYGCVLFNIDVVSDRLQLPEDMGLLKYSINNMMEELCEGQFRFRMMDYTASQCICLYNFDKIEIQFLREVLTTVQTVLLQHFYSQVTAAVGITVDDVDDLPRSLQSARRAVNRRFADGNGRLVFCEQTPPPPAESLYPAEQEARLLQTVRSGDRAQFPAALDAFFDAIRPCGTEFIFIYLMQFDQTCQKLEAANHLDQNELSLEPGSRTLEDYRRWFSDRLLLVLDTVLQRRGSNADKIIQRVNRLVEDNLCDPNLSVTWLADEVNLSVNYLRNIYKEATGENLSVHITNAKLALICELLQTSELTVQEISEKLGFSTRNYFFTFFKKNMGMTPKQYRLMHGNISD